MISWLADTSVLVRVTDVTDPQHATADAALSGLRRHGDLAHITPQVVTEFRAVATRPKSANGLGMNGAEADAEIARFEAAFPLLADTPAIFPAWKAVVTAAGVLGKQVHDARVAAVCAAYGVTRLLTFNVRDFTRLSPIIPGFLPADPADVAAGRA